jgi:hypothetical protein
VNYLLLAGVTLFSSACGGLLVTLLRVTRKGSVRASSQLGADPSTEKESIR